VRLKFAENQKKKRENYGELKKKVMSGFRIFNCPVCRITYCGGKRDPECECGRIMDLITLPTFFPIF
jgi:hypothetical protein